MTERKIKSATNIPKQCQPFAIKPSGVCFTVSSEDISDDL